MKGAFSWVTPKTISALFLTSDFIAFGVQGAAAGLLTSSDQSQQKPGQQTMLVRALLRHNTDYNLKTNQPTGLKMERLLLHANFCYILFTYFFYYRLDWESKWDFLHFFP